MYQFVLNDPVFLPHCGCAVSFTLREGTGLIIKGENGLGKTTLVRRFWHNFEKKSLVSYLAQTPLTHFYDRTLGKFRELFLLAGGDEVDHQRFQQLWLAFDLAGKEMRMLSTLSGGERQCLKICCALARRADLFLLDEPVQSLDEQKKNLLQQVLFELLSQGKAILMIEHDLQWCGNRWQVLPLIMQEQNITQGQSWTT